MRTRNEILADVAQIEKDRDALYSEFLKAKDKPQDVALLKELMSITVRLNDLNKRTDRLVEEMKELKRLESGYDYIV